MLSGRLAELIQLRSQIFTAMPYSPPPPAGTSPGYIPKPRRKRWRWTRTPERVIAPSCLPRRWNGGLYLLAAYVLWPSAPLRVTVIGIFTAVLLYRLFRWAVIRQVPVTLPPEEADRPLLVSKKPTPGAEQKRTSLTVIKKGGQP